MFLFRKWFWIVSSFCLVLSVTSFSKNSQVEILIGKTEKALITVREDEESNQTFLEVEVEGKTIQKVEGLGEEPIPFEFKGKQVQIAAIDLDKDGPQEFFVRASVPPHSGALWLFQWNSKEKKFESVNIMNKEYLPVDFAAPVKISDKGDIEYTYFKYTNDKGDKEQKKKTLRWTGKGYEENK